MAADNRNFVNKFANEGGGDVLVEDKRLEELKSATAKTSSQISTSTDYIPLQDVDGNLVKINAASFQEAVRNTLGGLLANNDKGTTISGIPALSGSGASLDFGSVSPANLASVLGGAYFYNTNATSESLDDLTVSNLYRVADGLLIVAKSQNRFVIQNHITYEGMSKIRYGIIESGSITWYNWTPVGTFGNNTLSELATALGAGDIAVGSAMVSEIESAYQSAGNFKKFEIESQAWNEGYVVGFKSLNGAGGCIIVTKGYGLIVGARLEGTWKFKTVVSFSL